MDQLNFPLSDELRALVTLLGAEQGDIRLVGGVVRDTLAGLTCKDIDLATRLRPEAVIERLAPAGMKVIPTGLAHGTVTVPLAEGHIEITTLRRDVSTDGRRATVAFSDDWRDDAARRDFTINALYADPLTGTLFDYFGGREDLAAGRVRFIGEPLTRIAEDHLRILRFFRFHARFARGAPDAEALAACAARANDLMALSRERIADEMLRILALPDPVATIALMVQQGIFVPVLPEITDQSLTSLKTLVAQEARLEQTPDGLRRLAALLPADSGIADAVGARLKLSNAQRKYLAAVAARTPDDAADPFALAYRTGREVALARLMMGGIDSTPIAQWPIPVFPLTGRAVMARGISQGPAVARLLKQVESHWITEGFPGDDRLEVLLDEVVKA